MLYSTLSAALESGVLTQITVKDKEIHIKSHDGRFTTLNRTWEHFCSLN